MLNIYLDLELYIFSICINAVQKSHFDMSAQ